MKAKLVTIILSGLLVFSSQQDKLRQINDQMQKIAGQLAAIKSEKASILNDIYTLELEIDAANIDLKKMDLLLAETQGKIDRKQKEESVLQGRIARSQENVRRILRVLYKMGELGYVKLFINIENLSQLFRNYRLIVALMDDRVLEIKAIRHGLIQLQRIKAELQIEMDRLSGLKSDKALKLGRLRGFKQGKLDIIAKINRQRDLHARLLDELKEEERNLTEFLNRKAGTLPLEKVDFGSLRGRLPWPLRGEIISSFGRKKSTRFDTYTLNNGIKIRPQDSDEVRSVHGGEVIYSDYFKGYGNLLIIQHPGNYHSLYGHCDAFLKKSGDRVTAGDVVAQAGSSGSLSGKCLYFEIRQNLISQDPLLWLEKR